MYVAIAKLWVKEEGRDLFEKTMAKSIGLAKNAKGGIDFKVLRPREAGGPYVLFSAWETAEDLAVFNRSGEVASFQEEAKALWTFFEGKSSFEEYDSI